MSVPDRQSRADIESDRQQAHKRNNKIEFLTIYYQEFLTKHEVYFKLMRSQMLS